MDYPEGATPLDPDEMTGLKFKHIETREQLDQMEQANIQAGLLWLKNYHQNDILTLSFCQMLHKQLFGHVWQWAGVFRQTEKNIGIAPFQISVALYDLFADTTTWIEFNSYSVKEIALRFHHRLVFIHPFVNGNGRHARIMTDYLLQQYFGYAGLNWAGQDLQQVSQQRQSYIQALRQADAHDFQGLLDLFQLVE